MKCVSRTTRRRSSTGSRHTAGPGRSTSSEPMPFVVHRADPLPAAEGPTGDALRAVLASSRRDAAAGTLPDFSLDRAEHAGRPRRLPPGVRAVVRPRRRHRRHGPAVVDPRRRGLPGAHLQRLPIDARSTTGSNVWNTTLLIGWDEPGGTYDHVPPPAVPPPDPAAPAGEFGFTFDRSGYRVPAIIVSPWVDRGLECSTTSTATRH